LNPVKRLAKIVSALDRLGIPILVMGGHAARYYGIEQVSSGIQLTMIFTPRSSIGTVSTRS